MWTKRAHQAVLVVASAAALTLAASSASANIIFDSAIVGLGQGFGAVHRLITVEAPHGTESACNSNVGGALAQGTCSGLDASFQPNGMIDAGGQDVNGPKNALASLSANGITNAESIVLIYNPSQQGSHPATDIYDILLKFYDSSNNLIISVDGGCGTACNNDPTLDPLYFSGAGVNLGNGGTGFALILDTTQALAVDAACGALFVNCSTVAAEVTIGFANDGPDSFYLFNKNLACIPDVNCPVTENTPEPITISLFGAGLAAAVAIRSRRRKSL
jgi:hypothetical protein